MNYIYIFLTIVLTVYGQLVIKWQVGQSPPMPAGVVEKLIFLLTLVFCNVWILSGLFAAFLASLAWVAAMSKFSLSHAYPFMSLAFVLVLSLSTVLFHEQLTWFKVIGVLLIVAGVIVGSQG